MASVEVEKLSEHLLKCPICFETYRNPKVLPCLHSFCEHCLQRLQNGENVIVCPTCRCEVTVPQEGVGALSTNFFINNMLDFISVQTSSTKPICCTNCEEKNHATSRCIECMEFLCSQCVAAHRRTRLTKDHEVISLNELQGQEVSEKLHRPLLCTVHEREALKYFCETCDEPVCRECLIIEHREHRYGYLKDVDQKHRSEVGVLVMNTKRKIGPVKSAIENIEEMLKRLDCKVEEIRQEIKNNSRRCVEVINEREQEMLTQITNIHHMKSKTLELQKNDFQLMLGNLNSSVDFTENVLRHGNEAEVTLVKKQMTQRLQELNTVKLEYEPLEDDMIEYRFSTDEFRKAIDAMGVIQIYHSFPPYCYATGIGIQKPKAGLEAVFIITTKDRSNEVYSGGGEPIKVAVEPPEGADPVEARLIDNEDGTYTVSYQPEARGNHTINITIRSRHISGSPFQVNVTGRMNFSKVGTVVKSFGKEGSGGGEFSMPWDAAIDEENGYIIVTDSNNHRVQVFDSGGGFMFKFGTEGIDNGQFRSPRGVARTSNGYIVVADFNNHRVQVFNDDGRFIRKFGNHDDGRPDTLNHPCGVECTKGGLVIVSEQDTHRIQLFDISGTPVRQFGSQGFAKGQFIYPHHVCVTQRGRIVVADCVNDRVQVFDIEGSYLFDFGKEGTGNGMFDGPEGITCDDEDNLLVCDYHNHRVQVFSADGAFVASFGSFGDEDGCFKNPCGIAINSDGNIVVVDSGNNRIQIF